MVGPCVEDALGLLCSRNCDMHCCDECRLLKGLACVCMCSGQGCLGHQIESHCLVIVGLEVTL